MSARPTAAGGWGDVLRPEGTGVRPGVATPGGLGQELGDDAGEGAERAAVPVDAAGVGLPGDGVRRAAGVGDGGGGGGAPDDGDELPGAGDVAVLRRRGVRAGFHEPGGERGTGAPLAGNAVRVRRRGGDAALGGGGGVAVVAADGHAARLPRAGEPAGSHGPGAGGDGDAGRRGGAV